MKKLRDLFNHISKKKNKKRAEEAQNQYTLGKVYWAIDRGNKTIVTPYYCGYKTRIYDLKNDKQYEHHPSCDYETSIKDINPNEKNSVNKEFWDKYIATNSKTTTLVLDEPNNEEYSSRFIVSTSEILLNYITDKKYKTKISHKNSKNLMLDRMVGLIRGGFPYDKKYSTTCFAECSKATRSEVLELGNEVERRCNKMSNYKFNETYLDAKDDTM